MNLARFTDSDESESGKSKAVISFNEELHLDHTSYSEPEWANKAVDSPTDADDDDELRPLQISIDGVLQPSPGKHFVKKSVLAMLKQQHIEDIYADINRTFLGLETIEMKKKEEEGKNGLEKVKESSNKGVRKEKEDERGKNVQQRAMKKMEMKSRRRRRMVFRRSGKF
ncbi:MAG: hypothetical protein Q9175_005615 [Cornicularia normoerica]